MGNTGSTEVSTSFSSNMSNVVQLVNDSKTHAESIINDSTINENDIVIDSITNSKVSIKQSNDVDITRRSTLSIQHILSSGANLDVQLDAIRTIVNNVENSSLINKTGAYSESDLKITNDIYQKVCNEMAYVLNSVTNSANINKVYIESIDSSKIDYEQANKNNIKSINSLMSQYASDNNLDYDSVIDEKENVKDDVIKNGFVTEFSKMVNDFFESLSGNFVLLLLSPVIIIIVIIVIILLIKLIYKFISNLIQNNKNNEIQKNNQSF